MFTCITVIGAAAAGRRRHPGSQDGGTAVGVKCGSWVNQIAWGHEAGGSMCTSMEFRQGPEVTEPQVMSGDVEGRGYVFQGPHLFLRLEKQSWAMKCIATSLHVPQCNFRSLPAFHQSTHAASCFLSSGQSTWLLLLPHPAAGAPSWDPRHLLPPIFK